GRPSPCSAPCLERPFPCPVPYPGRPFPCPAPCAARPSRCFRRGSRLARSSVQPFFGSYPFEVSLVPWFRFAFGQCPPCLPTFAARWRARRTSRARSPCRLTGCDVACSKLHSVRGLLTSWGNG